MPFKYDEDGQIVTSVPEGGSKALPVMIDSDGNETPYDPEVPAGKLRQSRSAAKTLQDELDTLQVKLAGYDGIEDPKALLKELEGARTKLAKLNGKGEGGESGEGDDERFNILTQERDNLQRKIDSLETNLKSIEDKLSERDENIRSLSVGSAFRSSEMFNPYLDEKGDRRQPKTTMDNVAALAIFGRHFRPENANGESKIVATYTPGGKDVIYSEKDPEAPAEFDEAMGVLFARWPQKNHYLPNDGPGGMGARESGGGGGGTSTISRPAFDRLSESEQRDFMKKGGKVVDSAAR